MRGAALVAASLGLAFLAACGGPPATPVPPAPADGAPIETRLVPTSLDPHIPTLSILAASDPGPAAASQSTIEAAALVAIRAGDPGPILSVARVAGDQVGTCAAGRSTGPPTW